ncbi:response regulator [Blastococcus saxobsidens]|uniref:Response regulator containing a CheY-like receiver domain and a GGDEF domain n=1 Tax=Blastococcus saxobsidens (strain DD2) TaxID=1146883 RepID=H6RV16_BLASD|nr:response regulator [Blastococcus saxobsidens]CCG05735.1 Response regulator containing a CheY-like receiver domain and a GGDEF domain [Blastococcus saxobsidens DD2]
MRALVIDDSRAMRRIVTSILTGLGYEVRDAGHGREGLDVLDEGWMPQLVCVDWNMPVMDGLQFVSAVRSNPAWRSVTIMMVTSESEHTQIVRALAAGAHEYVIKPFTADAIRDKLALLGLLPEEALVGHQVPLRSSDEARVVVPVPLRSSDQEVAL